MKTLVKQNGKIVGDEGDNIPVLAGSLVFAALSETGVAVGGSATGASVEALGAGASAGSAGAEPDSGAASAVGSVVTAGGASGAGAGLGAGAGSSVLVGAVAAGVVAAGTAVAVAVVPVWGVGWFSCLFSAGFFLREKSLFRPFFTWFRASGAIQSKGISGKASWITYERQASWGSIRR